MRKIINFILLITLLFVFVYGCSEKEAEKRVKLPSSPLMTVNSEDVYEDEFYKYISFRLSEVSKENVNKKSIKDHLVKDFILHRLLIAEAKKKNIIIERSKLNSIIDSMKTINGQITVTEFENKTNLDIDCLRELIEQRLTVEELLEAVANVNIDITETDLKKFYESKYSNIKGQKKAHLLHILTYKEDIAKKAMEEIKKGAKFEEIAKKYSVAPENNEGGDLGLISLDENPAIFKQAFELKPGKISGIIKSDYGFHIFKVLRYKDVHVPGFEDSKSLLQAELFEIKQQKIIREYIDELYEKAEITFHRSISLVGSSFPGKCGDN